MAPVVQFPGDSVPLLELTLLMMAGQMVGLGRLELPTSPLSGVRSNHLSYRPEQRLERRTHPYVGRSLGNSDF